ncbi:MAG: tetratricopeptide repeat protein, partial [Bacteroidota bacterium]
KAKILVDEGKFTEAEEILTSKFKELDQNGSKKASAVVAYAIGLVQNLQLKYQESILWFGEAVSKNSSDTEYLLYYGNQLQRIAQYDSAIKYLQIALHLDSMSYGTDSLGTYYNNLGSAYDSKGDYGRAIELYEKALAIDTTVYGLQHPTVATQYNNLGSAYKALGAYGRAIAYFRKALIIFESFLPPLHPNLRVVRQNLSRPANAYGMQFYQEQKWDRAGHYFQMGLSATLAAGDSSFAVTCLNNLGSSQKHMERHDSAQYHLEWGIDLAERLDARTMMEVRQWPDSILNHPDFPAYLNQSLLHTAVLRRLYFHKASTLWRMGRQKEATPIFKELWEGALKREDERLIKEIKTEGYSYD